MTLFRIRATICPLVIKPIYIFIFLLLSNCSLCVDPHFEACSVPKSCGEIHNISYPFYIEGLQEPYCGSPYPGFKFVCDKNRTIFKLPDSDQDYFVQDISYPNQSLRVLNRNIATLQSDSNISCSPPIQNLTLEREGGFELDSGVADLFLYFNCPDSALKKLKSHKIGCSNGGTMHTGSGLALSGSDSNLRCGQLVRVPVEGSAVESGNWSDYVNMLKKGFLLKWKASDCSKCNASGGKCGFNVTTLDFSCFCPDRPHEVRCNEGSSRRELKLIIAAPSSLLALLLTMLLLIIIYRRHKKQILPSKRRKTYRNNQDKGMLETRLCEAKLQEICLFDFHDLVVATNNFHCSNKLGQGGFGPVYKGKLTEGKEIAIKRLSKTSGQGQEEFMNEVAVISKLQHRNLVRLLGCCIEGEENLLIYEYMPNKSLDVFLFG